jgi:biopolymer transport protein ExbD/biopolymer transport protein TolR
VKTRPRKRPRPSQFLNGIDFWAFLSVELVLLMIFMVNAPSPHANRSPVDFAKTEHATPMPGALREDAMLITVSRDGNVYFGANQIRCNDLPASIRESVRRGSEKKVYLKVDARAKYGDAALIIDQIRQAGIHDVGIITEPRQPTLPVKRTGSL